jgi:hypothetical protein
VNLSARTVTLFENVERHIQTGTLRALLDGKSRGKAGDTRSDNGYFHRISPLRSTILMASCPDCDTGTLTI